MSELIHNERRNFHFHLLTTASAVVLIGASVGVSPAQAEEGHRSTVWIELGGQLSALDEEQEVFAPSLMDDRPSEFSPSARFEKPPHISFDETGSVSIQPENLNWIFEASVHYGRSVSKKHVRQQTNPAAFNNYVSGRLYKIYPSASKFADTESRNTENHLIVDFQVGKEVGLGMFGGKSSSTLSLGVRFGQFGSNSNIFLKSDPDWHFNYISFASRYFPLGGTYHSNLASLHATRSFRGIGPSLSWTGAAPLMQRQDSELTLDWGLNGSVLFGRQKANIHYQTTGRYHTAKYYAPPPNSRRYIASHSSVRPDRSHSVVVPNVGGFAGLSFRYQVAKVSFGYRADFFFGAMDGGIDARQSGDVGFFGPFATVSIGLGG